VLDADLCGSPPTRPKAAYFAHRLGPDERLLRSHNSRSGLTAAPKQTLPELFATRHLVPSTMVVPIRTIASYSPAHLAFDISNKIIIVSNGSIAAGTCAVSGKFFSQPSYLSCLPARQRNPVALSGDLARVDPVPNALPNVSGQRGATNFDESLST
jgi:hypothetical protein